MSQASLSDEVLRRLPKVLLHEHLDGCLRPATVLELARSTGYDELPESDPVRLGQWFFEGADRGSLPQYLEGFRHTIAVMQSAAALERVAYELAEDLAAENVVYFEVRFAPHFHTTAGLGLDAVMEAVLAGLARAKADFGIESGVIVCALRNQGAELSLKLAELAVSWFGRGCAGFDLAGEEAGHPPKHHLEAFQLVKRSNGNITIHAGESFGPESIWQALQFCGAHRIGHGTRLIEDIVVYDGKVIQVGGLARYVLDHRVPIECCLQSNVHTGAVRAIEEHPFRYFLDQGYRVTLNTDNRLMSHTSMTEEFRVAHEQFACGVDELELVTVNAMKSAFFPYAERCRVIRERIRPGYQSIRQELGRMTAVTDLDGALAYRRDPSQFRGALVTPPFASAALEGNPLGDPRVRDVPVYLPPQLLEDPARQLPVVFLLAGFTGRGQNMLETHPWKRGPIHRYDARVAAGEAPPAILVMPDAFTLLGGSQYVDSPAVGRYEEYVAGELVPWVDATFGTSGRRAVCGKSSGGFGALHFAMHRPGLFAAAASISGDCCFEYSFGSEMLAAARGLLPHGGDPQSFLDSFAEGHDLSGDGHAVLNIVAMSACYSPRADGGFDLPMDVGTGALLPDVWERWLAFDPLRAAEHHVEALGSLELLYLEAGERDEFHLQFGLRRLVARLEELGIPHEHLEHGGGHFGLDARYDDVLARVLPVLGD